MKIKRLVEIGIDVVNVEWEDGKVDTLMGRAAQTLLLMTEMKVGEKYKIHYKVNNSVRFYTVKQVCADSIVFIDGEMLFILYFNSDTFDNYEFEREDKTAKDRVLSEAAELTAKIEKLECFIGTQAYATLSHAMKYLLDEQIEVMKKYQKILEARLSIWDR